jgi:hypothetical protein
VDTAEQAEVRHQPPRGRGDEPRSVWDEHDGGDDEHDGGDEGDAAALPPGGERRRDEKAPLEPDGGDDAGRDGDRPDERRDPDATDADRDEGGEGGECEASVAAGVGHAGGWDPPDKDLTPGLPAAPQSPRTTYRRIRTATVIP